MNISRKFLFLKYIYITLLLGYSVSPIFAQDDKLEMAKQFLEKSGFDKRREVETRYETSALKGLLTVTFATIEGFHFPLDKVKREQLEAAFDELWMAYKKSLEDEEARNKVAEIYARKFTKDELYELTQFYETVAGRKLVEEQSEIDREVTQIQRDANNGALAKVLSANKKKIEDILSQCIQVPAQNELE